MNHEETHRDGETQSHICSEDISDSGLVGFVTSLRVAYSPKYLLDAEQKVAGVYV